MPSNPQQRYRERNKELVQHRTREWQKANLPTTRAAGLMWRIANLNRVMWKDAAKRAKRFGLEFDLELFDIHIPSHCPVLGIPLAYGVGKRTDSSPSLDRIDPVKGYTYDNVCVISWRANDLKANGTLEEFRQLVAWMETK